MTDLLLDPTVEVQVRQFAAKPSHALMLIGPEGAGKRTLAVCLAVQLLGLASADALRNYPYYFLLEPDEGVQRIEAIRTLQEQLRLKTLGRSTIRRVIIIEAAHSMTTEAQNAFLKLLEEPPTDTVIIMCVAGQRSMLPTVYSRAQQLFIKPLTKNVVLERFTIQGHNKSSIEKAYHMSNGQVGLLHALLDQDTQHPLVAAITQAKSLLVEPVYERLAHVEALAKQKDVLPALLQALQRVSHAALIQAGTTGNSRQMKRWHQAAAAINQTQNALRHNANGKLLLTDLLLNL